jgi:alkylated DNA nucleotide flippase Atl1
METHVRTPQDIFMLPQHLVVPPFQRPYVWDEEEQWAPLWQDVRRLAELRLTQPAAEVQHFLGAIVVQAQDSVLGGLQANSIIDGQQRLTTLQLLMDAAGAALEALGHDSQAGQLDRLTHNEEIFVPPGSTRLKVRHSNKDGLAFDEVMNAEVPVDHAGLKHAGTRVVRAHAYFADGVTDWLEAEPGEASQRAQALTGVLTRGLQIVAINLTAAENSQEIFETLNARGTPLTAADLIRNFVFQRLAAEGADTRAHLEDWPFETTFWEQEVPVGRFPMQRSSLFFNQWLTARLGVEISPRATFTRFKQFVELGEAGVQTVAELLPQIRESAERYEGWIRNVDDPDKQLNRVELAVYRMRASETELLTPLLLWLHEPGRDLEPDVIERVTATAESWLVRRLLLRLSLSSLGPVVANLIRVHASTPPEDLAGSVARYLARLNVTSTYWPGDREVREALAVEQVFRRFKRPRTRMLLEAIENSYRRTTKQPQVPRRGYPIEHVLPQSWTEHWPVDSVDAEAARAEHVHRLGNLTLLTSSLNSKVSNGGWATKRAALQQHDTLLLNSRLLPQGEDGWTEAAIDRRTSDLTDVLFSIWPIPDGHEGAVVDPHEKSAVWIQLKHLVDAGLLIPGTVLNPRSGGWVARSAVVGTDGSLDVDAQRFDTPSGAAKFVTGRATNGWTFWTLPDNRRLADVRAEYTGEEPGKRATFDWSPLHTILAALPEGHWTTYGNLADVVGTAAQPLGNHIAACPQCVNAHRVLTSDGKVSSDFVWTDPTDTRDARDMLLAEGTLVDNRADPARELKGDALQALIDA